MMKRRVLGINLGVWKRAESVGGVELRRLGSGHFDILQGRKKDMVVEEDHPIHTITQNVYVHDLWK